MKKFIKKYYLDILIFGGILLLIVNYFFKLTEYSVMSYKDYIKMRDIKYGDLPDVINYNYVGFVATVFIAIGLYFAIRKLVIKLTSKT